MGLRRIGSSCGFALRERDWFPVIVAFDVLSLTMEAVNILCIEWVQRGGGCEVYVSDIPISDCTPESVCQL